MDGEILPLIFPRSRISVAFDKKSSNFLECSTKVWPKVCGVFSGGALQRAEETKPNIDRTAGSQRKFKVA